MPLYRKKPVVIEAILWDGANIDEILGFILPSGEARRGSDHKIIISTLEGEMTASRGDWIIKGVSGEFYPCKPEIFAATYETERSSAPASTP